MFSKTVIAFIALAACAVTLSIGMPSHDFVETPGNRTTRQVGEAIAAGQAAVGLITGGVNAALNSPECTKFGCHKGYCWAYCHAVLGHNREWCYTTRGSSQDYNYVGCSSDADCGGCWKCAASCAVGF